ncbi:hypothetical protein TanjilG_11589 [Lupinus angustifolius]|uniref:Myb/SANT-like DNA-binding domain-containing protein n=1 Tax=Lupinus angustifolius TaxID=3871 RepID=A0A1J7H756_LUPAN|nr:PREDICTED: uncharacterized protein LOC109326851 [Lupinus angustifolius]OIV98192.1 hypothetical protein TanjilG_11589 [Lupinus angustifolius]
MEPNGLGGGMFSSMTNSALLGVENTLQQQNLTNPQNTQHLHHSQMVSYANSHQEDQQQQHQSIKLGFPPYLAKKQQSTTTTTMSDEDEPGGGGVGVTGDDNNNSPKRKVSSSSTSSPWQRMKWSDTMVRLLIMAVYYIGDEGGGSETTDPNGKKKPSGGLLQKKGKWKSVSRAMMEKGFYVSPQQCEDKFNDLNKRYKRVNDILGKGTACRVVENQNLLDSIELEPKMKEEVRKLLNSKHLFFREMCAYHNSCGHGGGSSGNSVPQQQVEVGIDASQCAQQKRGCSHSSENGGVNFGGTEQEGMRMLKVGNSKENYNDDEDNSDDSNGEDNSDDSGEDENESAGGSREDDDGHDRKLRNKRTRIASGLGLGSGSRSFSMSSQLMQQLNIEVSNVFQDGGRSAWEKKHWMRLRIMQLEEQHIKYQSEAFELDKQRLKWVRFSSKKERDMEKAKIENERRRLENERMILLIRQKELELMKLHRLQQQQRSST